MAAGLSRPPPNADVIARDRHPRLPSRRILIALTLALLLAAGAALGVDLYYHHRTGDIYHSQGRFVPEAPVRSAPRVAAHVAWPLYGYTPQHTRFFPAPASLHGPFRRVWGHGGRSVLEFPPVMWDGRLFQLGDDGVLMAISKYTGRTLWSRRLGVLSASSPAVTSRAVYATVLKRGGGSQNGRVTAVNSANGRIVWSRNLPSPTESSPMLDGGRLFIGSQDGTVYALSEHDGRLLWTYRAAGAVKASPTARNGRVYFGDYGGQVQAIDERDGHRAWTSGSGGAVLGNGQFYATAAVVYGRVYLGNTDGRVYAYDAASGRLDWAKQTGAYVYSSPAVADAPGLGPTIYAGSYDGNFYALDARSGRVRWTYAAGGRISGSATVVGRTVYFADLGRRKTIGLGISTGRKAFELNTGSFDPVISDGARLFVTGYTTLYSYAPRSSATGPPGGARSAPTSAHAPAAGPRPAAHTSRPRAAAAARARARAAAARRRRARAAHRRHPHRGASRRRASARRARARARHQHRHQALRRPPRPAAHPPSPPRPVVSQPAADPFAFTPACASTFIVILTTRASGTCGASGEASLTG